MAAVVAWNPEKPMSRPGGFWSQPYRWMPSGSNSRGPR